MNGFSEPKLIATDKNTANKIIALASSSKTKNKYLQPYYQIFGHTYCKKEIITEDFAMLDCGKKCFELNSEELKAYEL